MNEQEQQFAVRYYRRAGALSDDFGPNIHFFDQFSQSGVTFNQTFLPLLKETAAHDLRLDKLMVKGKAVAHFRYRQRAAQISADIEQKPASYIGLSGEAIDSKAFPGPYEDQDRLLAKLFLDSLQKAHPDWMRRRLYQHLASSWESEFGPQVRTAIRAQAMERNISLEGIQQP